MQTVDTEIHSELKNMARSRGVSVQELLRAVIVPDWMKQSTEKKPKISKARPKKRAAS